MDVTSEKFLEDKRKFSEFLDSDHRHGMYASKIGKMLSSEEKTFRLAVDLAHLREFDNALFRSLMNEPGEVLPPFEKALDETIRSRDPKWLPEGEMVRISLTGEFGAHTVSPRSLLATMMSKLVNVQGIVTKASLVRPKMVQSVHYCEATKETIKRIYRDVTTHDGPPTGSAYPTRDEEGNLLTTEFGLCKYRDSQMITLQELPETAPPGQLPRSVELIIEDDLVDSIKPGDRVEVAGIYKAIAPAAKGSISGLFKALVCAVGVKKLKKELGNTNYSKTDLTNIKALAKRSDVLEVLGRSLAPSIFGHDIPKEALVLLLLGGIEKNLPNGTHLRGDINCLFVGDPGVAKSQLLRSVINIAPLAVNTTGRGSSGVGLTAAVTVDKDTGEKRLEAGAMVLADRGVVCIDEFDKMSDLDRVAIHEVMEQQTVTIAKAGIHTTLNARCSVVAAANPLYGTYEASLDKAKNINLPDSLLSRFDLIFIMLDDYRNDSAIAGHVLGQHRYRALGDDQGISLQQDVHNLLGVEPEEQEGEDPTTEMHVKYNVLLHGKRTKAAQKSLPLSHGFLKKYIHYAKTRIKPELTPEAMEEIASYYTSLRQFQSCPKVTVRMLETIIRLATAHAKLRLRNEVEVMDVDAVKRILDHVTGFHSEEQVDDDLATTANNSIDKIELDRQKQRMVIEARQAAEKKAQEEADTTEVKRKARGTKRAKKGTKRHRPDSSDADDQESDEEADEELAEAAEGVSDEDEDMVDLAEGEKGEEQGPSGSAEPETEGQEGMGSEQLQVGSQGGSGRAVDVDLLVDTLKKVLDKAEVRREGRENGVALEKLISIVQAESRALRSLTRQQLKKGIEAFNKKFGDAVMADDTVLYIL